MNLDKREAIVIGLHSRGERAVSVEVLSKQFGREYFTAFGFRGSRRRFSGLDLFCQVQIETKKGKGQAYINEIAIDNNFPELRKNMQKYALANLDLEWVRNFLRINEGQELYPLLIYSLQQLSSDSTIFSHSLLWLHYLAIFGFAPELSQCSSCANLLADKASRFFEKTALLLCPQCAKGINQRQTIISSGALKTLQLAQKSSLQKLRKISVTKENHRAISHYLLSLGKYYSGKDFRSENFLRQVFA